MPVRMAGKVLLVDNGWSCLAILLLEWCYNEHLFHNST